jgi:hypothetical protein
VHQFHRELSRVRLELLWRERGVNHNNQTAHAGAVRSSPGR